MKYTKISNVEILLAYRLSEDMKQTLRHAEAVLGEDETWSHLNSALQVLTWGLEIQESLGCSGIINGEHPVLYYVSET